jgi:hypothetical protein
MYLTRPTESQYRIASQPVQRRKDPDPGPKQLEQYASLIGPQRVV